CASRVCPAGLLIRVCRTRRQARSGRRFSFLTRTNFWRKQFNLHRHRVAPWLSSTCIQSLALQDPVDRTLRFFLYLHARLRRRQAGVESARFRVLLIIPVGTVSSCLRSERGHNGGLSPK